MGLKTIIALSVIWLFVLGGALSFFLTDDTVLEDSIDSQVVFANQKPVFGDVEDDSSSIEASAEELIAEKLSSKKHNNHRTNHKDDKKFSKVSQRVLDKFAEGDKVRVIVGLGDAEQKGNVLAALSSFDFKVDMKDGFAGYVDAEDLAKLDAMGLVDSIFEDMPIHTMTYQGFGLIGLNGVLSDDIETLFQANPDMQRILPARGKHNLTGKGQSFCLIDSGLYPIGPEFEDKILAKVDYTGTGPGDAWNHGTNMAGIIAAKGVKMEGIAPDANVINLKVTNSTGTGWTSYLINALDWCNDNKTKLNITTIYIGVGAGVFNETYTACNTGALTPRNITNIVNNNITIIAPSGNEGSTIGIAYPACVADAISVGGVGDGSVANYPPDSWELNSAGTLQGNRREGLLDILAPGDRNTITTRSNVIFSNYTNSVADHAAGTSIAAAYVAGSTMIFREYWDNRNWNYSPNGLVNGNIPNTIEMIFSKTGKLIEDTSNPGVYYPRLDLRKAFDYEEWAPSIALNTANESSFTEGIINLDYNSNDYHHGIENCSLYINGTYNQTHYYDGSNTRRDTCTEQWGFDCSISPERDNTFDNCSDGYSASTPFGGGGVTTLNLSDVYVLDGEQIEVTCDFYLRSNSPVDGGIFYYNGSDWSELWHESLPVIDGDYQVKVNVTADSSIGQHWVRCSYLHNPTNITNYCAYESSGSYHHDNDDVYFYVTDDVARSLVYYEGNNSFVVDAGVGSYDWNVSCYDDSTFPNGGSSEIRTIQVNQAVTYGVTLDCFDYQEAYTPDIWPTYFNCMIENIGSTDNETYILNITNVDNSDILIPSSFIFTGINSGDNEEWDFQTGSYNPGIYYFEAFVYDEDRPEFNATSNFTLEVFPAPNVTLINPLNGSSNENVTWLNLSIVPNETCQFWLDSDQNDWGMIVFDGWSDRGWLRAHNIDGETIGIDYFYNGSEFFYGQGIDPDETYLVEDGFCDGLGDVEDCDGMEILRVEADGTAHLIEVFYFDVGLNLIGFDDTTYESNNVTTYVPEQISIIRVGDVDVYVNVSESANIVKFVNVNEYVPYSFKGMHGFEIKYGLQEAYAYSTEENITLKWYYDPGPGVMANQTVVDSNIVSNIYDYYFLGGSGYPTGFTAYGSKIDYDDQLEWAAGYYPASSITSGIFAWNDSQYLMTNLTTGWHNLSIDCREYPFRYQFEVNPSIPDSTPPTVTLLSDQVINVEPGADVTVEYNTVDSESGIKNCSLYVNGALDQTNFAVVEGITQSFDLNSLSAGTYNWKVSCYDDFDNKRDSRTYTIYSEIHSYRSNAGMELIGLDKVLGYDKKILNTTWPSLTHAYLEGKGEHNLTGKGQTVCVIDSGINHFHQEFNNGKQVGEIDLFESDNDAQDSWNHGSRVNGIMVAKGVNFQGIAHNANFVNIRITNSTGGDWTSDLVNALDWCYNNRTKLNITTVYFGVGTGMANGTETSCTPASSTGQRIQWLTQANITVVASAGIDSNFTRINYPACVGNAISVGAVPSGGGSKPADTWNLTAGGIQSNRRDGLLDILAPGGSGATATTNRSQYIGSTRIGTHIATSYVAGSSMIFREYWDARNWNYSPTGLVNGNIPNTIEMIFSKTGKMIEDDLNPGVYYPRLDLYRAIHYEEYVPEVNLETLNDSTENEGVVTFEYNANDVEHRIKNCSIYIEGVLNQTDSSVSEAVTQSFNVNLGEGNYSWRVECYDNSSVPNLDVSETRIMNVNAAPDTIPTAAITGLTSTVSNIDWIYWEWTNPVDADFSENIIYIDGVNVVNTSNNYYNATGFAQNSTHTINVHTIDLTGNVNNTDVTDVQTTKYIDLILTYVLIYPDPIDFLQNYTVNFTIRNIGTADVTDSFQVEVDACNPDYSACDIGGMSILGIDAGESLNGSVSEQLSISRVYNEVNAYIVIAADGDGEITEMDESNNFDLRNMTVINAGIPPAAITGLSSPSKSSNWIYWAWTNPGDADFDECLIFIEGVNVANTSNNYYNATGLTSSTSYTINVHTMDVLGHENLTDVTDSITTDAGCVENIVNTSWTSWVNTTGCLANNTVEQERNLVQYDDNFCGTVTNTTHYEYQAVACTGPCVPNVVNTSWSSWTNVSVCLANDTIEQERSLVQYDDNYCGTVTNTTHYEYQTEVCDFCTPNVVNTSWTAWVNISGCHANNTVDQMRNLTEFDDNYCGEVSNNTVFDYRAIGCGVPCTEDWIEQLDSCLVDDTQLKTYFDNNSCGTVDDLPVDNGTTIGCNYCGYSVINTTWSLWQNMESCQPDDTQEQNRTKTEYDENYGTCYLATLLASDLWNSGNNNTYWDFNTTTCDYCTPNLVNTTWTNWYNLTIHANNTIDQERNLTEFDDNYCDEIINSTHYEYQVISFVPAQVCYTVCLYGSCYEVCE